MAPPAPPEALPTSGTASAARHAGTDTTPHLATPPRLQGAPCNSPAQPTPLRPVLPACRGRRTTARPPRPPEHRAQRRDTGQRSVQSFICGHRAGSPLVEEAEAHVFVRLLRFLLWCLLGRGSSSSSSRCSCFSDHWSSRHKGGGVSQECLHLQREMQSSGKPHVCQDGAFATKEATLAASAVSPDSPRAAGQLWPLPFQPMGSCSRSPPPPPAPACTH